MYFIGIMIALLMALIVKFFDSKGGSMSSSILLASKFSIVFLLVLMRDVCLIVYL